MKKKSEKFKIHFAKDGSWIRINGNFKGGTLDEFLKWKIAEDLRHIVLRQTLESMKRSFKPLKKFAKNFK